MSDQRDRASSGGASFKRKKAHASFKLKKKGPAPTKLVCRLCDELVEVSQLSKHSLYCVAMKKMVVEARKCDDRLLQLRMVLVQEVQRNLKAPRTAVEGTRVGARSDAVVARNLQELARCLTVASE